MRYPVNPEIFDSWDSMEGIGQHPHHHHRPTTWHGWAKHGLEWTGLQAPGFGLAAALAILADQLAGLTGHALFGSRVNPLSGIPIAVALGILICNAIGVPHVFQEGLRACMRPLQRLAIMMLGFRLSLFAVGGIGLQALPVVFSTITAALVVIPWIGKKAGLSRRLSTLIAVGTSICGVSAIMATAPAIEAEEGEVSYAVACVAIFGMMAMIVYPFIVPWLLGNDLLAIGIFFGIAIHDTAQVTGAALAYQQAHQAPAVLNTATVVKIMRNFSMAAVIPLMAGLFHKGGDPAAARPKSKHQILPPFVLGFLGFTVLRTIGDASPRAFGVLDKTLWGQLLGTMDHASTWFLTVVMAAVGLSTSLHSLKRLGWRPFFVGLAAAVTVGGVGLGMIRLLSFLRP